MPDPVTARDGRQYLIVREQSDYSDYPAEVQQRMAGKSYVLLRSLDDDKLYWTYRYSFGLGVPAPAPFSEGG